jgi:hypothetical protein
MTLRAEVAAMKPFAPSLLLVFVLAGAQARAEEPARPTEAQSRLDYVRERGAEGCIEPGALMRAVDARLSRSVFSERAGAPLTTRVRARREAGRFVVDTALLDASGALLGTRRLETAARHCSALDDSLALVLSLALDVRTSAPAETAPPSAEPLPPSAPEAAPPAAPSAPPAVSPPEKNTPLLIPATTHAAREPWSLAVSLGPVLGAGLLPSPALAARARLELWAPSFWPLGLAFAVWNEQRLGAARGVDFGVYSVELTLCPLSAGVGAWRLQLCAEQLLGRVDAAGFGFDEQAPQDRWLVALGVHGGARYELGALFAGAELSLLAPLVQRRYFYTEGDEVTLYDSPRLLGLFGVSIGVSL